MNPFESGQRKIIPAVLIYVKHRDRILMIHKNSDFHAGKWNGLGGKLELDESSLQAATRELKEESGITLPEEALQSIGVIHFPNFKPLKAEDWLVFVFTATLVGNEPALIPSKEGELKWIPQEELLDLNLWPADLEFLPYVLEERSFSGTVWYEGEKVLKTSFQLL
jgi:8-oxo-dGTP diphosphatase